MESQELSGEEVEKSDVKSNKLKPQTQTDTDRHAYAYTVSFTFLTTSTHLRKHIKTQKCTYMQDAMGKFYSFNFPHARCLFCLWHSIAWSLGTVGEKKSTMMLYSPPVIWKQHSVLRIIWVGRSNKNISRCLCVNTEVS